MKGTHNRTYNRARAAPAVQHPVPEALGKTKNRRLRVVPATLFRERRARVNWAIIAPRPGCTTPGYWASPGVEKVAHPKALSYKVNLSPAPNRVTCGRRRLASVGQETRGIVGAQGPKVR